MLSFSPTSFPIFLDALDFCEATAQTRQVFFRGREDFPIGAVDGFELDPSVAFSVTKRFEDSIYDLECLLGEREQLAP